MLHLSIEENNFLQERDINDLNLSMELINKADHLIDHPSNKLNLLYNSP
jgi:hypothetical protein